MHNSTDQNITNTSADLQNFDPNQDIDLSAIESQIIDTSRGDSVDYQSVAYDRVYRFKCLNCGYMYEGKDYLETCPRCGSNKLDDSDAIQMG